MKKVLRIGKDVKSRRAKVEEYLSKPFNVLEMDTKLQLIQELIPLGLLHVQEVLEEEVLKLAGQRYKRNGLRGHDRWGRQWGSVYIGEQKIPVKYTRVRDTIRNREVELGIYRRLQTPGGVDERVLKKVLHGISLRRYSECSEMIPEVFGLSSSNISRRFKRASERKLKELRERRLDSFDIAAIFIDGKVFKEDEMIIALGVTIDGEKVVLGFTQAGTENAVVCKDFLKSLLERGLKVEEGVLCIMDGSKGFRKAVEDVFGRYALIQRCQWHKRRNVVSYLPKGKQKAFMRALQKAYEKPDLEGAKEALKRVKRELSIINESAVSSLEEGLEETLTLHRLGLFKELGRSFKTSNCIESLISLIGQKTGRVDYWKNSNQKQRWLATALLDIEPRLNRIRGYKYLPQLRIAIQRELNIEKTEWKEVVNS